MSKAAAPRLWIIDPSIRNPEDQGVESILADWPGESRVFRPALRPGDGPTPESGYATNGIVVMGSAVSVHDALPWLDALRSWLEPVIRGEIPTPLLGICFGHQLIAHLAGGEVGYLNVDREKRLGVETTEIDQARLVPGNHRFRVVVSHREEVKRLPSGYRVVARREGVAIDGLEHLERPVFSVQFHPEAGEEFAGHVGIPAEKIDAQVRETSRRILGAWRESVLHAAEGATSTT